MEWLVMLIILPQPEVLNLAQLNTSLQKYFVTGIALAARQGIIEVVPWE